MVKRHKLIFTVILFIATLLVVIFIFLKRNAVVDFKVEPLTETWEKALPFEDIPDGLVSLSAESCGVCHQAHFAEWKNSTHAHAWTDMQFQAELKKESSPYLCINCHIPLENQQEYLVDGLIDGDIYKPHRKKNPQWDQILQQEGVTCAVCHVRDGEIIGTIGSSKAPHRVRQDAQFLSESLCITCHNAVAELTPTVTCTFETGDEWKKGPYAGEKNCIQCHMEVIKRPLVNGYEQRNSHFHAFPGSGISKVDTVQSEGLNGLDFYPGELKKRFAENTKINYSFGVKNARAGHRLPTGDPERFFLIEFKVLNASNKVVWSKTERIGELWEWYPVAKKNADNNLEPNERRNFAVVIDKVQKGNYTFIVEVTKNRMDAKTAEYNKLTKSYPLSKSIFLKSYPMQIVD